MMTIMTYTTNLNKVLSLSRQEAKRLGSAEITPEHILLALVLFEEGRAFEMLKDAGLDPAKARKALEERLQKQGEYPGVPLYDKQSERILRILDLEAKAYKTENPDTEHLLMAMLRERINPRKLDSVEAEHVYYETCLFAIELEHVAIDYLEDVAARDSGPRGEAARSQAQVHRRALQNVLDRINFGQDTQLSAEQTRQHFDDSYDALPERERKNFAKQFRQAEMYANEVDSGALTIELEQIRRLLEAGEIEPDVARKLRENVYVMQMALEE